MPHAGAPQEEGRPLQLALALDHAESFAREDFLVGPSNAAALDLIERWPDWPDRIMVLVGPQGSGKSHLAAIWAAAAGARSAGARSIEKADMPALFATGALVLEDLAAQRFDERALFHLINHAREERAFVLITARSAPSSWRIEVPDLASRLRVLPVIELTAPDDALLRAIIVKLFADRQVVVEESLIGYLTARIERTFAGAQTAVDTLDREALRQKRPVSRALAVDLFRVP
jgi:chromosomal replication initiation ATPase DnaA